MKPSETTDEIEIEGLVYVRNTMFTNEYPNQRRLRKDADGSCRYTGACAWLDLIASLRQQLSETQADSERLDWLEAHAMRDDFEEHAGIRIERFTGTSARNFADACFRLREWGETPLDDDGELDYSDRPYRQSDHTSLRAAIDAARSADQTPTSVPASSRLGDEPSATQPETD